MIFVAFLMLAGPGALAWKLCDLLGYRQSERLRNVLITLAADSFLIFIGTYFISHFVLKTGVISLSSLLDLEAEASLFHVSFVCKFSAVSCVLAALLAAGKTVLQKLLEAIRGNHHEKNP